MTKYLAKKVSRLRNGVYDYTDGAVTDNRKQNGVSMFSHTGVMAAIFVTRNLRNPRDYLSVNLAIRVSASKLK